jgi:hypothetical protein
MTATFSVAPNGNGYISALYQNDNNYQYASSKTLFLNVNIPDFTLGPASGVSVIAAAGQPGSTQITISPATQTPSTVSMSWYGISANAIVGYTLSLNPQQVSLNGSATAATLSLTPIGSAPQTTIQRNVRRSRFIVLSRGTGKWWLLGLLSGLAAVLVLGLPGRERRYRVALGFSAACFLCFAIGCGGGSASTGGGGGGGGGSIPTATTTTLTTSIAKADQNTPFVLTAKVTGQHPLTGTITIYDNGTAVIGPLSLTNGQAQTTAAYGGIFGVGVHQLSASYSGDTENLVSTSAPMTQAITGIFNIQIQGYTGADGHFLPATVGIQ